MNTNDITADRVATLHSLLDDAALKIGQQRQTINELREALKPFAEWWQRALEQSASKNQPITSVEMTWGLRDDYGNYPDEWPDAFRCALKALKATGETK